MSTMPNAPRSAPRTVLRSRDNPRVKEWVRLVADPRERKNRSRALIEGIHLVASYLQQGGSPACLIASEAALENREIKPLLAGSASPQVVLSESLFKLIADTQSPSGIAAEIEIPQTPIDPSASSGCVFLDGIQDAGNVGTIVRTAAAFGVKDVVLGPGCADPWAPKTLRAGMGGHFFLRIATASDLAAEVRRFGLKTVCTAARGGEPVGSLELAGRVGWVFGSEAHGVSARVAEASTTKATIPLPGGAESLNVAASAAICLYEARRQVSTRAARS